MSFKRPISPETRAYAKFLFLQQKLKAPDVARKCGISVRSVYRISNMKEKNNQTLHKTKPGRPRIINRRRERQILRAFVSLRKEEGTFSSKRLMNFAGLSHLGVSDRTVRRVLNRNGYFYLQARKKGLMSAKDLKRRVTFARNIKANYSRNLFTSGVAFYLDGTSFVHKINPLDQARAPKTRVWRRKSEGLQSDCLSKGSKVGSGGKSVKLIVAISYGKGVIGCIPYEKMDGTFFSNFIDDNFSSFYKLAGKKNTKLFVQDGDPSQNSAKAKTAMGRVNAQLLAIPPRSPDLNPIENLFKLVRDRLRRDALEIKISHEKYHEFSYRVIQTFKSVPSAVIDKVIASMPKRIDDIITRKGHRLKY